MSASTRHGKWSGRRRALLGAATGFAILASGAGLWYRSNHRHRVEEILDGDTLRIDYHGASQLIQLAGADAPELHKGVVGQPFAHDARQYLIDRVLHKEVWVEFQDPGDRRDDKGRLLCWVWLGEENLSHSLVQRGLARFSGAAEGRRRKLLLHLEEQARRRGRGMWSAAAEQTPRSEHREGAEFLYKEQSEQPFKPAAH